MQEYKKAWEYTREIVEKMIPFPERAKRVPFDAIIDEGARDLDKMKALWHSLHEEARTNLFNLAYMVQDKGNMGYDVSEAEKLLAEGLYDLARNNEIGLYRITCRLFRALHNAPKIPSHPYWSYTQYESFEQYKNSVEFPKYDKLKISREELYDRIYAGWMAQVCAGAVGTPLEGYHTINIENVYGWVDGYTKMPEMYNDDLTFELVFLEEFIKAGNDVKADDIAEMWAARIPSGYTAELIALNNIKNGIYPPESGTYKNPFSEFIGAQMRGGVCGMVAPANPELAAELAWRDATISHANNGILGEVFNAVMVSLGFVESDLKKICRMAIDMMPKDSEYRNVVEYAWKACEKYGNWRDAWIDCDDKYKEYCWIHAYPNAAIEVIALYFCENDFNKLVSITAMCGLDVDCNAAQVANIPAVYHGMKIIDEKLWKPFGEYMETYLRGMEKIRYDDLAEETVSAIIKAGNVEII
ncbi:MAG: ADP-ribosylglycohydrolase family protein [Ruminococcaceae bacterium]|nr:ADP-ribosylglycohydrolase family protein [Oscillospiraceae bacterium]